MNATFEKWAKDNGYVVHPGCDGYVYSYMGTEDAYKGWQAAIASLEVTPELVALALYEMCGESDYQPGYGGYVGPDAMKAALTAVFAKLKESANG